MRRTFFLFLTVLVVFLTALGPPADATLWSRDGQYILAADVELDQPELDQPEVESGPHRAYSYPQVESGPNRTGNWHTDSEIRSTCEWINGHKTLYCHTESR
jgi:hypothetical protein